MHCPTVQQASGTAASRAVGTRVTPPHVARCTALRFHRLFPKPGRPPETAHTLLEGEAHFEQAAWGSSTAFLSFLRRPRSGPPQTAQTRRCATVGAVMSRSNFSAAWRASARALDGSAGSTSIARMTSCNASRRPLAASTSLKAFRARRCSATDKRIRCGGLSLTSPMIGDYTLACSSRAQRESWSSTATDG